MQTVAMLQNILRLVPTGRCTDSGNSTQPLETENRHNTEKVCSGTKPSLVDSLINRTLDIFYWPLLYTAN